MLPFLLYNIYGDFMFQNNSIVICSNDTKTRILKSINKLVSIKFFTLNSFIKELYFDYDERSILYIIKNYNVRYEIALEYLNNLIYIEDKKYNIEKLDFLVKLKNELISNDLLIFNSRFRKYVSNKKIYIYNTHLSKFNKYLLKDLDYEIVDDREYKYEPKVYEFNTDNEEIEFVAKKVCELIDSGVSVDNIKLTNVSNDYIDTISKIFNFYNLKINKHNRLPIYSNIIGSTFYKNIDSGIDVALESIDEYKDTSTYSKIIDILNRYVWCQDTFDLKILLEYALKHEYIENIKYTNTIEVVDYNDYSFNDEYVFMIGFNQGIIPITYKDEDYISDKIKPDYIDSTSEKNNDIKNNTIKCIKSIKNLTITYKLKSAFDTYYPSSLIDELGLSVEKVKKDYSTSYSEELDLIHLSEYLDNLIKFNEKNNDLDLLYSNYDIPYLTYNHSFSGLDKNKLNNYIKKLDKFNLSYSTMDDYNKCSFKFYIEKVLNLKKNIESFGITLGNIYHYVLEKAVKREVNVQEEVERYISENEIELDNSTKFFIDRSIKNIEFVIAAIKDQNKYSKLKNVETEKYVKVKLKDNINFIGFIDKIVYDTFNDYIIATIIDYKTYVKKPSLKYIDSGIGLQLPTYMYLASNAYKNIKFAGFYLQNITLDNKSDEDKLKSLKLIGYTNTDKEVIEKFDYNYMDSNVIDGLKVKKDGEFSSNSLKYMLNDKEIDEIIEKTKNKIYETLDNILDSKFDINPKYDDENIGCEFCDFRDLCFKREFDLVKISGGEEYE